jgi:hypothetical protein
MVARCMTMKPPKLEVLTKVNYKPLGPLSHTDRRIRRISVTAGVYRHVAERVPSSGLPFSHTVFG